MFPIFKPVYCDYIAQLIKDTITKDSFQPDSILCGAGKINWDLNEQGSMESTKKTISVADINGRFYEITIKEVTR